MASSRPVCDSHPNLQMIPCSLKRTTGQSHGYVCPVPSCGRHRDDEGYFDVVETKPSLDGGKPPQKKSARRSPSRNHEGDPGTAATADSPRQANLTLLEYRKRHPFSWSACHQSGSYSPGLSLLATSNVLSISLGRDSNQGCTRPPARTQRHEGDSHTSWGRKTTQQL